jgi:hypothetical protein
MTTRAQEDGVCVAVGSYNGDDVEGVWQEKIDKS